MGDKPIQQREPYHLLDYLERKVIKLEADNDNLRAAIMNLTDCLIEKDTIIDFVRSEIMRLKGE